MEWKNIESVLTTSEREKLAQETKSSDILSLLANDPNFHIREKVAANDNTLPETLNILANDDNLCVVFEVISNRKTYIKTLKTLELSPNLYISKAAKKRLLTHKRK